MRRDTRTTTRIGTAMQPRSGERLKKEHHSLHVRLALRSIELDDGHHILARRAEQSTLLIRQILGTS